MEEKQTNQTVVMKDITHTTRRRLVLGGGIVALGVILVCAGILIYLRLSQTNDTAKSNNTATKNEQLTAVEQANQKTRTGDYNGGLKVLESQLKPQASAETKAKVSRDKARLALRAGKNDEALSFAIDAEKLDKSRISAKLVAIVAEKKGDKALALQYYKLVDERFTNEEKQVGAVEYEELQAKIKELSI